MNSCPLDDATRKLLTEAADVIEALLPPWEQDRGNRYPRDVCIRLRERALPDNTEGGVNGR